MIRLENVLKISLQDVLKMSWRRLEDVFKTSWRRLANALKTSWRRLEDIWPRRIYWSWPRRLQDVLKTSWRCLEDVFAKRLEDVLKTSWRCLGKTSWKRLEDVWPRRIYWSWPRRLEDVFWRRKAKANIFALIKTSSRRPPLKTKTKDVSKTSPRRLHQNDWLLGK